MTNAQLLMFNSTLFNIPNLQLNCQINIKGKGQIECLQTLSESFSNDKHMEKIKIPSGYRHRYT